MKKKVKDLPSRTPVKGGLAKGPGSQDNITLVRAAKPTKKKDLPARKDVKGGQKTR